MEVNVGGKWQNMYNQCADIWRHLYYRLMDRCRQPGGYGTEDTDRTLMVRALYFSFVASSWQVFSTHSSRTFLCCLTKARFWSAHQRFFRNLCTASKVDKAIELANKAVKDGYCCVIGLQSTGEARSARTSGNGFVSSLREELKEISEPS